MRKRLFVDMDGTLAKFQPVDTLETLYEKNYYLDLPEQKNVVQAIKKLTENPNIEVYILSAVLSDSLYALDEKNLWLDVHLPEIDEGHRIFPPCGAPKALYIPGGLRPDDHLLDDYTQNLILWEPPAKGIKLLNGINHTKGTWDKNRLRMDKAPDELTADMENIILHGARIMDYQLNPSDKKNIAHKVTGRLHEKNSPAKDLPIRPRGFDL